MNTLAHAGPGPWFLFFPLVWAAVIVTVITVLRRSGWRRHRGPGSGPGFFGGPGPSAGDVDERSPIALLGHRFAAGEIDEDEYWRRLTVLEEQFGRRGDDKGRRS
ncbi:SHOCT domain-containing protein [Streptomyces roseicoloratus]|uniref:SHOCT domain-containing protein n=1 Tax=Streptomyces roseicoloratus TaxID=2508722 RepID=A0ABY9S1S7_9ACTN|nr:SHOCT domain-containing protein [Streptomyces roseicoloratus]WMX48260.1 SHOCT domain-containing protein [Streptomyces roseicoloratus]